MKKQEPNCIIIIAEKDLYNSVNTFFATETVDCGETFLERQENDTPNLYTEEKAKELVRLSKKFDKKNEMHFTYKIYRLEEVKS